MKTFFINPRLREEINSFDKSTVAKFTKLTDLLEEYGDKLGMPYSKQIDNNLHELRIRGQKEIRVFYCFYQSKVVSRHRYGTS